jgi:hypothetical protein
MHTLLLCLATVAVGVDVGWQRMPNGGMEYIIQLDPQSLESLRDGQPIQSDLHPKAGEVRSYRIVVGKNPLPRETPLAPPPAKTAELKLSAPQEVKPEAPRSLPADSGGAARLGQPTSYVEPGAIRPADKAAERSTEKTVETQPEQPAKPWMALYGTLLGLFASIGANVFLGWIAWDSWRQCRVVNVPVGES